MGVHELFRQIGHRLSDALDYDDSVSPADGQVIGWWAGGSTWQPQTVISQYQRGPIGGTSAATLTTQTYSMDATGQNVRRWTLTGNPTLSVPTGGVDGQRITLWLGASGATRTFTFASGFEVSPLLPSRTISIASGTWEMVEIECRSGTWRLIQTDQLLFSAADVGGLTQAGADGRYSRGVIARNRRAASTAASASTTEVNVSRVAASVVAGRLYRVKATPLMFAPNATLTAFGLAVATLRITTDGSTPSSTSALLAQVHTGLPVGLTIGTPVGGYCEALWTSTITGTLSALLSFYRGAGTAGIALVYGAGYPIDLQVEDLGVDPGSTGATY